MLGYCVLLLPNGDWADLYFNNTAAEGLELADHARHRMAPLVNPEAPNTETLFDDLSACDRGVVAMLSMMTVERVIKRDLCGAENCIAGISYLTGERFFRINGSQDEQGYQAVIQLLSATNIEEAECLTMFIKIEHSLCAS